MLTVKTRQELQRAVRSGEVEFQIVGKLAEQVHKGRRLLSAIKVTLALLAGSLVAVPLTGGLSVPIAAAATVALTGVDIALIIMASAVGLGLLLAIYRGYEVDVHFDPTSGKTILILRKKGPAP